MVDRIYWNGSADGAYMTVANWEQEDGTAAVRVPGANYAEHPEIAVFDDARRDAGDFCTTGPTSAVQLAGLETDSGDYALTGAITIGSVPTAGFPNMTVEGTADIFGCDITGGTYNGPVTFDEASIGGNPAGGTFEAAVTITDVNEISGGSFNGDVEITNCYSGISGTFAGAVTIAAGDFFGGTFNGPVTINGGNVDGPTFADAVTFNGGWLGSVLADAAGVVVTANGGTINGASIATLLIPADSTVTISSASATLARNFLADADLSNLGATEIEAYASCAYAAVPATDVRVMRHGVTVESYFEWCNIHTSNISRPVRRHAAAPGPGFIGV